MPRPKAPAAPRCPRCGYDQSGAIATFTDACPTTGTCSECGLDFRWSDLFAEMKPPPWSYEHGSWKDRHRLVGTLRALAWPPGFWRRVSGHMPVHMPRIVFLAAAASAPLAIWLVLLELFPNYTPFGWHGVTVPAWIALQLYVLRILASGALIGTLLITVVAAVLAGPASRCPDWPRTLLRAWLYALVALAAVLSVSGIAVSVPLLIGPPAPGSRQDVLVFVWAGVMFGLAAAFVAWLLIWWYAAAKRLNLPAKELWLFVACVVAVIATSAIGDLLASAGAFPI
ncbi:MAG: hypothetical protein R3B68_14805 [Phycisphaerales bacterium]